VEVIGQLTPVRAEHTKFLIVPIVGLMNHQPTFRINTAEATGVFEIPIDELLRPAAYREQRWTREGASPLSPSSTLTRRRSGA
jgi:hypothetical protein